MIDLTNLSKHGCETTYFKIAGHNETFWFQCRDVDWDVGLIYVIGDSLDGERTALALQTDVTFMYAPL